MNRRLLIKQSVVVMLGGLVLKPIALLASWPKAIFDHQNYSSALEQLLQGQPLQQSDQINLKVPPISQNGVAVPAAVSTSLNQVESITLFVENNPNPMVAEYLFFGSAVAYVATRIKMNKSSLVHAIVKADGKYYGVSAMVAVKRSGCYETGQ